MVRPYNQYGPIEGGVILMCSRDLVFQSFEIFDDKYERYKEIGGSTITL